VCVKYCNRLSLAAGSAFFFYSIRPFWPRQSALPKDLKKVFILASSSLFLSENKNTRKCTHKHAPKKSPKYQPHPLNLRLEVQVAGREKPTDVEPVPLSVLEPGALVVERVLRMACCVVGLFLRDGLWVRVEFTVVGMMTW
jgi:hypothetical protein